VQLALVYSEREENRPIPWGDFVVEDVGRAVLHFRNETSEVMFELLENHISLKRRNGENDILKSCFN
jgi:hypothetical protein